MTTDPTFKSDKELWRSLVTEPSVAADSVSDLDFAAWLDGRLPAPAAARVEAAVAASPELRRAALELADILGKPLPSVSSRLEVRAKALIDFAEVDFADGRPADAWRGRVGFFDWLFASNRRFVAQRAMALTAAIAIAISGFALGGGLGASVAEERYASIAGDTVSNDVSGSGTLTDYLVSGGI